MAGTPKHPLSLQGWFNLLNLPGLLSSCFPDPLSCLQPPLPLLPFVSPSPYCCQVVLHITVLPAQCYCPPEPRLLTARCWDSSEHLCSRHWHRGLCPRQINCGHLDCFSFLRHGLHLRPSSHSLCLLRHTCSCTCLSHPQGPSRLLSVVLADTTQLKWRVQGRQSSRAQGWDLGWV